MKTKIFKCYDEYERWTESFDECADYMYIPTAIVTDAKVSVDMFTDCKSWKTAVRRFGKTFADIDGVSDWIEFLYESFECGCFECHDTDGGFSFGAEWDEPDCWYIYLNFTRI